MSAPKFGTTFRRNPAESYQQFFVPYIGAPAAVGLIEAAAPAPGERVLDVGCGTGVVTRAAAERVGAQGRVVGLDATTAMLEVARAETAPESPITWQEANAESLPWGDDSFDLVLCQMSLQFFSNKLAALREMRRVLAPGGRMALNVTGPTPELFGQLAESLAQHVGPKPASFCHLVFSVNDADELRDLATEAGFSGVDVRQATLTLKVPAAERFLWGYIHSTPLATAFADVGDDTRAALERDVRARWQPFATDDGMTFSVGMTTVLAKV